LFIYEHLVILNFGGSLHLQIEKGKQISELDFMPINKSIVSRDQKNIQRTTYGYTDDGSSRIRYAKTISNTEITNLEDTVNSKTFNSDGTIKSTYKSISIKENGNVVEQKFFNNGELNTVNIYKFNSDGDMAEKSIYHPDGSLKYRDVIEYTGNSQVSYNYNHIGELIGKKETVQDSMGNVLSSKSYYGDGGIIGSRNFIYNDQNLMIEKTTNYSHSKQKTKTYKYQFDDNENWIVKTHFVNSIPQNIEERTITYYTN